MLTVINRIFIGAIIMLLSSLTLAATIYVKHDATGNNDGTSWTNAYTNLQTALTGATSGDEIWVAKSVYKPSDGTDRTATFQLKNGVALYGGFAGTETARADRDWNINKTVLSGDIDNDDTADTDGIVTNVNNISGDNVYTVVTGSGTDNTAILDGFVITGGLANGNGDSPNPDCCGAGIYNNAGSPTLVNLNIIGNNAEGTGSNGFGGGMYNYSSSNPILTNIAFSNNVASSVGSGMYNNDSSPTLINVTISGNYNSAQQAVLNCATCDEFYYTLDGSTPTTSSILYANPIAIPTDTTTTLKYISVSGSTTSEVTTETYLIDTQVPTVNITAPEDQTKLASLAAINGTATDGGIGVDYTEIQITDGSLYLAEDGSFGAEAKWLKATGTDNWEYDTSAVTFPEGNYTIIARSFDKLKNTSNEISLTLDIAKDSTKLDLETSATTILNTDSFNIVGKLSRFPENSASLKDIEISLTITAPDATPKVQTTQTLTDAGQFEFKDLSLASLFSPMQNGAFKFQVTFSGNTVLTNSESNQETVLVGASAGYAILIQGKSQNEEVNDATIHQIYQKFKARGFNDDNIKYFNYTTQEGVDGLPTKANIAAAFTSLQSSMNSKPAPFYVVMIGHGGIDGTFPIYNSSANDVITPTDLDGWLDNLENGLNARALEKRRMVMLGACYSGSFIPEVSQAGRVIITSATAQEESYKGLGESSSEFFMEEFFIRLGKGDNFKQAFELATEKTEIWTRKGGSADTANRFYDDAVQHPLLDDNGDGKGSNTLSTDGQQAETVLFGISLNSADNPAEILSVSNAIYLSANETTATLEAVVNDGRNIASALVDIRKPTTVLSSSGTETTEQLEIPELSRVSMSCSDTNCTGEFDQFTEPGMYEAFYFVRDNETLDISPIKRSVIYKNKVGNTPSNLGFELIYPNISGKDSDGKDPKTTLLLVWKPCLDPDGSVTYNLILSEDENFTTIAYRLEELTTAMTYIDENVQIIGNEENTGLKDQTTYYWKVEAVDPFGGITLSKSVFSFKTNNTNAPPGIGSLHISSALDFSAIGGADITLLDEFGNPLPAPDMHQDQGSYNMLLPHGRRLAKIKVAGYEEQEVEIDTTHGTTQLNVEMIPTAGIPSQPGELQFTATTASLNENTGTATILVERVNGSDTGVTVNYATVNGSATAGSDYTNTNGTLTWQDKEESAKTINLPITNDLDFEGDETLTITLSNPTGGTAEEPAKLGTPTQITITIVDDDTAPEPVPGVLQFSASTYSATEGDTALNLNITRTSGSDGEVSVQYMVSGTATLNADYTGGTGTLTWPDGDSTAKSLNLNLIDDDEVETSESLNLTLFNPTGNATLGLAQATLSIADNDEASVAGTLQFAITSSTVNEGDSATISVTRTDGNDGAVTVQYLAAGGSTTNSDYTNATGTLTWTDGDSSIKSFTVSITDDTEVESTETLKLMLSNPTGGASLGSQVQTTLSISDNDEASSNETGNIEAGHEEVEIAGTLQFSTASYTAIEGYNPTISVTRNGGSDGAITVQYLATAATTAANTDYANASGTLTWSNGDSSAKLFTVTVNDDSEVEGSEIIILNLSNPTGGASLGSLIQTNITITDNDVAIPETPQPVTTPSSVPTYQPVTTPSSNYEPVATSQPVTTPNTVTTYPTGESAFEAGTLQFALTTYLANEGDGEFSGITVTRTGNSQGNVSIQYSATANGTGLSGVDYTGGFGTLTWADGEMQPKVLPLTILADAETESLETINFMLFNPTGPARLGSLTQTTLIIVDDDVLASANLTRPSPASALESLDSTGPDLTTINPKAGQLQFSAPFYPASEDMGILTTVNVIRTGGSEGEVSVQYTILENGTAMLNSDYIGGAGQLIWADGDSSAKSVPIMLFDDRQVEELKTIPLRLIEPTGGSRIGVPDRATLVVVDNDGPAENPLQPSAELISSSEKYTPDFVSNGSIYTLMPSADESESGPIFSLPNLGRGMTVTKDGSMLSANTLNEMADIRVVFRGGGSVNPQEYQANLMTTPSQMVTIRGEIEVAESHIGQEADILVVAGVLDEVSEAISLFLMVDEQERLQVWDGEFITLVGSKENVRLAQTQRVEIYHGFIEPVRVQIYFGYRLQKNGSIYFNGEQSIEVLSSR